MSDAVLPLREDGTLLVHSSRRAVAPMLAVLASLSAIELIVVHVLVAFWWPALAVSLSLISLAGLVWLLLLLRSFRTHPSVTGEGEVVLRCGRAKEVRVPAERIAGVRTEGLTRAVVDARGVLNLALLAFPNAIVDIAPPLRVGHRQVHAVAHRFDDLPAFVAAVQAVCARG